MNKQNSEMENYLYKKAFEDGVDEELLIHSVDIALGEIDFSGDNYGAVLADNTAEGRDKRAELEFYSYKKSFEDGADEELLINSVDRAVNGEISFSPYIHSGVLPDDAIVSANDKSDEKKIVAASAGTSGLQIYRNLVNIPVEESDDSFDDEGVEIFAKNKPNTNITDANDDPEHELIDVYEIISDVEQHSPIPQQGSGINNNSSVVRADGLDISVRELITFQIIGTSRQYYPAYQRTGEQITIKFRDPNNEEDTLDWLRRGFDEVLDYFLRNHKINNLSRVVKPNDRVALVINNSNFAEKPIYISYRRVDQLSSDVILERFAAVMQSNAQFFFNDELVLHIDHVAMPLGKGRVRLFGSSFKEFCRRKLGYISYKNPNPDDTLCLAYALVLAKAHKDENIGELGLLKKFHHMLKAKATTLCIDADVDLTQGGGLEEIIQFQTFLHNYKICVYNDRRGKTLLFEGESDGSLKTLNILFENGHYSAIKSLTAAFTCGYYCEECHKGYSNSYGHRYCIYTCPCCFKRPVCNRNIVQSEKIKCALCLRIFWGQLCYENHLKGRVSVCDKFKKCKICFKVYLNNSQKKHECGVSHCRVCNDYLPINHKCFMPPYETKRNDSSDILYIFFDLESNQDEKFRNCTDKFVHIPNLCVVEKICTRCFSDDDLNDPCIFCGDRKYIFEGRDCIAEFMNFIINIPKIYKNIIILAHNMGGYDGHFILRYIYSNGGFDTPKIIINGTKIILIQIDNRYKFLDSLNYFGNSLAKLPKMFNFSTYKGYYPHYFNTNDNADYVGSVPGVEYFGVDSMSPEARIEFLAWHNTQTSNNFIFNNRAELKKYCCLDVEILRKTCVKFCNSYWAENKIDPFLDASTIASSCNKVFRSNYLQKNTIGIIPKQGYRFADNQSFIGLKWLLWIEKSQGITLQYAARTSEVYLKEGLRVDGFHEPTNTVYEFLGCYYHGCIKCYPIQASKIAEYSHKNDQANLMFTRREATEEKLNKIIEFGYTLIHIYECDFKKKLRINPDINRLLAFEKLIKNEPLDPRNAFYGGRTNAAKLYYKVTDNEKINYYDICSLYPFINKYFKYPLGHPKIYVGDECKEKSIDNFEGILKCTVLPPKKLLFPVLPVKMHGKLLFFLCHTCALHSLNISCTHTEAQRSFTGTWVVDEVVIAVENGYKVLDIHEIWEYTIEKYDVARKSGGLFGEYIDNFLKIKAEASGYPNYCTNDNDKNCYINDFLGKEGILLAKEKIIQNPGLRSLAKLMLNSFWGKFGQRENMSQTAFVTSYEELVRKLLNPDIEVEYLINLNDTKLLVSYKNLFEANLPLNHVNVAIAAYTTTGARLELYKYLKDLGPRILYYDTDSVIFTEKLGEINPQTGSFLGYMTDELSGFGQGSYITEFVSGGPKNYGFRVYSPITKKTQAICKVKGITLNYKNLNIVNFDTIVKMVTENVHHSVDVEETKILRTYDNFVFSTKRKKKYGVCYTKRRRLDAFDTLPFGYCDDDAL